MLYLYNKIAFNITLLIHFQGHFIFSNNAKLLDLDMIVKNLVLQSKKDKITTKNQQDVYAHTA